MDERRKVVQEGYDAVSERYRSDDGAIPAMFGPDHRPGWIAEVAPLVPAGGRVLDLGCGCGIPVARDLVERGFEVLGVDLSPVQVERARRLVPGADLRCADMVELDLPPGSFDLVVCLYALFHLPVDEQPAVVGSIHRWLRPGGRILLIVGDGNWSGTADFLGATMFWSHADLDTSCRWLSDAGFAIEWTRFVPEGHGGHHLALAAKPVL